MPGKIRLRLFTVDEFLRILKDRIFRDERLELIRGELMKMAPISDPHALCVTLVGHAFAKIKPKNMVNLQRLLQFPRQQSVTQPDIVLLRCQTEGLQVPPPNPEDAFLLVEVSDSSLAYDRAVKIPLYAESGVPEAWLIDLNSKTIFVYRRPSPEGYREVREYRHGDEVSPEAFPDVRIPVEAILG